MRVVFITATMALLGWWLVPYSFITVPEGSRGILWERFNSGTMLDRTLQPGQHIIWPFNKIFIYLVTPQKRQFDIDALNQQGAIQHISCTVDFTPNLAQLTKLHLHVGQNYFDKIIVTELSAMIRKKLATLNKVSFATLETKLLRQFNEPVIKKKFKFVILNELNCVLR